MGSNVYIEDVLIVNFLTSFVICSLTKKCLKLKTNKLLFYLCIVLCVASSVLSAYVTLNEILFLLFKFAIGLCLSLFLSYKQSIKTKINTYICFMFNTFVMGGICYAILFLSGKNIHLENINSNKIVAIVILCSIFYYFVCNKLLKVFYSKQNFNSYCHTVKLTINGVSKDIIGFLDSGNNLTYQNLPVCIISYETALLYFKDLSILDLMLKQNVLIDNSQYIKYSTIAGQGSMLVFAPQQFKIKLKENYIDFNCFIGISLNKISTSNSYSILLNSKLF